jgi:hypothetical protein
LPYRHRGSQKKAGRLARLKLTEKENQNKMLNSSNQSLQGGPHQVAARGFGQVFGIHPAIAFLTLIVDTMLFGGEVGTLGASLPISFAAAGVLAFITFLAQRKWYGDDDESAFIKALILGFLTAIPTALPAVLYVPSGLIGLIHGLRKKQLS